jgi:FlaA1/EpsC-like NDP-sugar epimerase
MAFERVSGPVLALSRPSKRMIVVAVDIALCALTVWVAYYLRLGVWVSLIGRPSIAVGLSVAIALPIFMIAGLYRTVFRHIEARLITVTAAASICYGLCYAALVSAYGFNSLPRTLGIIQPVLLFLAVCTSRVIASWLLTKQLRFGHDSLHTRVLIYGAGSSGRQLARAAAESRDIRIVGFIDDDSSLQGSVMLGKRVYPPSALPSLIDRYGVGDVLLALPSAPRRRRNEIIADLRKLSVGVRTLPGLMDLAHGRVHTSDLRDLTIEDLLGRDPVEPDHDSVQNRVAGHTILVTGAGGSIGSELCRQLILAKPKRLLLLEASEYALYTIHRDLKNHAAVEIVPLLGSVTDRMRISEILESWRPAMVFHAAAYKHVPLVEHNPLEGLRNNVFGTMLMAELSIQHNVHDFVLVSTDKAVRPTNVMGASKRLAELCLQAMAAETAITCLSMVRFGNVLGSSGSVVPLFREQIHAGGPVTITHQDITRYFMTIPEAAQLVVQASTMARGGEVFVLDMGDPVRIYDLARNLIQLSGMSVRDAEQPHGDIEIVTVGLRPGEKLYEELLIGNDPLPTRHPRIMMANEAHIPLSELRPQLEIMHDCIIQNDVIGARTVLCRLVPEYSPTDVVDFAHVAREAQRHAWQ